MSQHLAPFGISRLVIEDRNFQQADWVDSLPSDVQADYLSTLSTQKFFDTYVSEYSSIPESAQQAYMTGDFGDLPLVVVAAGQGLNNTQLTYLSNRSQLVYWAECDHGIPFRQEYSDLLSSLVKQFVQNITGVANQR